MKNPFRKLKSFDEIVAEEGAGYSKERAIAAFVKSGYSEDVAEREAERREKEYKRIRNKYFGT